MVLSAAEATRPIEARAPTLRSLGLRKRCPKIQDVYLGEDFTVYGSGVTCRSQSL